MLDFLKRTQRDLRYLIDELRWKPPELRHEQAIDNLRKYRINLRDLNLVMDDEGISPAVGRFPRLLSYHHMSEVILSAIRDFEQLRLPYSDETRNFLISSISENAAEYLAGDPEAFPKFFTNNNTS